VTWNRPTKKSALCQNISNLFLSKDMTKRFVVRCIHPRYQHLK